MLAVFVRLATGSPQTDDDALAVLPTELAPHARREDALVSRTADGPFLPLEEALERDARLTDELAVALELQCVVRYEKWRRWLALGLLPIAVLVELERELYSARAEGVGSRLLADVFLLVLVGLDLFRKVPRHARVAAMVLLGISVRYADMIARSCGSHPGMFPMMALAMAGSVAMLTLAPSRSSVRKALLAKLGAPSGPRRVASLRQVGGALVVATGLPLVLLLARALGVGVLMQGALLVVWAVVAPAVFARGLGPAPLVLRAIGSRAATTGWAVAGGLAATVGLTRVAHHGLGAVAHASQCLAPAAAEHSFANRLLDAESVEVTRSLEGAHAKWVYLAMTILVVPVAEERVFRDLLQRVLRGRFGRVRGLTGASALFGLAHVGVYRVAMVQAALLGVGFGMAYEEGGLLAAVLTHALWNLYMLG